METWTAVDSVRVVREYADRAIPEDELLRILHAGRRAGSSRNKQRWDFIVVRDPARRRELTRIAPYGAHMAQAPVVIALVSPDPRPQGSSLALMWDQGRAAQNMVLAAWELGIGSCPITVYEAELGREILGYPETEHCAFMLSFGYPSHQSVLSAPNKPGGRKAVDEVVHWETW